MVMKARREAELSTRETGRRAARISLVLTDNDGVLTDTGVYYASSGEMLKRYSVRDGMGVELLRNAGIETGIVSAELSENLKRRAEKLQIRHLYLGVKDKECFLAEILSLTGRTVEQLAYIGDDVNDEGIMHAIAGRGLTGAPGDAVERIKRQAHFLCRVPGGHGAFREFADWIIDQRVPGPALSLRRSG